MKLRTSAQIAEQHGISPDSIHVLVHYYRKEHGRDPSWLVTRGDTSYINEEVFFKYRKLEARAWEHTTEYLYWWLTYEPFTMSDRCLARIMSDKSKHFKSENSWQSFFSNSLFRQNITMIEKRYTMNMDFLVIGTKVMQILINEAKNGRYFDEKEYNRRIKQSKNNTSSNPAIQKRGLHGDEAISA